MDTILALQAQQALRRGATTDAPAGAGPSDASADGAFAALLQRKRQDAGLKNHALVGLGMRVSAGHQDLFTQGVVRAFEQAFAPGTETQKYVRGLERMDEIGVQASQLGTLSLAAKIVVRNIESLTTKMS